MGFKFLEHTADLKILVEEPNLEKAFETSALAMRQAIAEDVKVRPKIGRLIGVEGRDISDLLYNFLEEFIYLLDAENFILSEIEDLEIDEEEKGFSLSCKILGDKANNYQFTNDVKAITFNDMKITENKKAKKVTIQFVLDV